MRFLFLTQYFPPETGAAQTRLCNTAKALQRLGHQVEVVTALPNYPNGKIFADWRGCFYRRETLEGITVHRVWLYAATGAGWQRLLSFFSFAATALWGLWKARRPDYVLLESPPLFLGPTAWLAARLWRVPLIVNIADLWPDTAVELGLLDADRLSVRLSFRLEAWLYRQAAFITTITHGKINTLQQQKQVPTRKLLYLPNGIDTTQFCPVSLDDQDWQILPGLTDRMIFLYAGAHGYSHGMEIILDAAEQLRGTKVLFLLVGGGSEKSALQADCARRQLENVIFWPPQPPQEIARLYHFAVAGISTLRDFPLADGIILAKTLANLASGKPVIYSGAGEGARLVREADAGIVTPPGNAAALAEAVRQLVQQPELAAQFGANARHYAEQHLDWDILTENWLKSLLAAQTTDTKPRLSS